MNTDVTVALALGAMVVLVAAVALRVADRAGLPSLLLYLALGIALGESGLGVQFEDYQLTQTLGYAALVIILAEGGLTKLCGQEPELAHPLIIVELRKIT